MAKRFPAARVPGIDYWAGKWEYSRAVCERNATIEGVADRVNFQKASASALPFEAGSFDAAVSNLVFHASERHQRQARGDQGGITGRQEGRRVRLSRSVPEASVRRHRGVARSSQGGGVSNGSSFSIPLIRALFRRRQDFPLCSALLAFSTRQNKRRTPTTSAPIGPEAQAL